jgi:hypothetical protein
MEPLIAALLRPAAYDHPVGRITLIETHISWVLLTGTYAYKLKKPVNLGFVDFSTPALRRRYCREELRLNRRLAPDLYLGLREVHGPAERASFHGGGPAIEVALQMREFPQQDLLPAALARGEITGAHFDQLADTLAAFHAAAAAIGAAMPYGTAEQVAAPAFANLTVLHAEGAPAALLEPLRAWSEREWQRLREVFAARRRGGAIRECHGDLHLGNMVLRQGRIEVFDCLEFSEGLRWIDPVSDMAFLVMDLEHRGHRNDSLRVLNRWLAATGDYPGLRTWCWYRVYRALVRAKVAALRGGQTAAGSPEAARLEAERDAYLELAGRSCSPPPPALVITSGVSGSGKSHLARRLCERLGWIHLRSDVERLRWFGRWGAERVATLQGDPYRHEVGERLYGERLPACAAAVLDAGLSLIVDATFLLARDRWRMRDLARVHGAAFLILACSCPEALARRRITARQRGGGDPSEADAAVLSAQLESREPLRQEEKAHSLAVTPEAAGRLDGLAATILSRLEA